MSDPGTPPGADTPTPEPTPDTPTPEPTPDTPPAEPTPDTPTPEPTPDTPTPEPTPQPTVESEPAGDRDTYATPVPGQDRLKPIRRRTWIAVAVGLPVALLIAVLATRATTGTRVVNSPLIGKPVPTVSATTIDDTPFDLAELRGKWVLVNFFATWCVECVREHPDLIRFDETHRALGDGAVVGVVYSDSVQAVKEFRDDEGGRWPMLDDPGGRIALDFGVAAVPESFLINPDGVVVAKVLAGVQLEVIERIMAGNPPT